MRNKYELISFILRADNRKKIIEALKEDNKTAAGLVKITGMYKSHVSRALKELKEERLVECLNPNDREYKFYKLTKKCSILIKSLK